MNPPTAGRHHWLTVASIAIIAVTLTVGLHEGAHAATCAVLGNLEEFSALHVQCAETTMSSSDIRVVAASGVVANFVLGTLAARWLGRSRSRSASVRFGMWLFAFANWAYASGYFLFSGLGGVGDLATVTDGWGPTSLVRTGLVTIGLVGFSAAVWFSLRALGTIVGGETPAEQVRSVRSLLAVTFTFFVVTVAFAGALNSHGITGLPSVAGVLAVAGATSPLLWMPQALQAKTFRKLRGPTLRVDRQPAAMVLAVICLVVYLGVLGPTVVF
jgi:hypothetical protein